MSHMRADDSPATSVPGLWRIQEPNKCPAIRYPRACRLGARGSKPSGRAWARPRCARRSRCWLSPEGTIASPARRPPRRDGREGWRRAVRCLLRTRRREAQWDKC
jgi:hypothetical protein